MKEPELIWEKKKLNKKIPKMKIRSEEYFKKQIEKFKKLKVADTEDNLFWNNRLIMGDNLYVMKSLLDEFENKIRLIYIDPPFATGEDFSYKIQIEGTNSQEIKKWVYKDNWGNQITPFLNMMYPRLKLMKRFLSDDGSIYIHCDYHSSHYIKLMMDEIFGKNNFQREITWNTQALNVAGYKSQAKNWIRASDIILFYTKSQDFVFNKQYIPRSRDFIEKHFTNEDEKGRFRKTRRGNKIYIGEDQGEPVTTVWTDNSPPSLENFLKEISQIVLENEDIDIDFKNFVENSINKSDIKELVDLNEFNNILKNIEIKKFIESILVQAGKKKNITSVWNDILSFNYVAPAQSEGLGYPTQKPESLLARIIKASSNKGDIVADFFCGSGVTPLVAERLDRRWIGSDLSAYATYLTKKRLLAINQLQGYKMEPHYEGFRPFQFQILENYNKIRLKRFNLYEDNKYIELIAEKLNLDKNKKLGGKFYNKKQNKSQIYYISSVEENIDNKNLKKIAEKSNEVKNFECISIIIWEIKNDIYRDLKKIKKRKDIDIFVKKLPRDTVFLLMNPKLDLYLYDIYAIKIKYKKITEKKIGFTITDFEVQENDFYKDEILKRIKNKIDLIDFWGIDYNYDNHLIKYDWYSYKVRNKIKISLKSSYTYEERGKYTILIKIIDVLGNEYIRKADIQIK